LRMAGTDFEIEIENQFQLEMLSRRWGELTGKLRVEKKCCRTEVAGGYMGASAGPERARGGNCLR